MQKLMGLEFESPVSVDKEPLSHATAIGVKRCPPVNTRVRHEGESGFLPHYIFRKALSGSIKLVRFWPGSANESARPLSPGR